MSIDSPLHLSGVIPPMLTPLTPSGEIDQQHLEVLVSHMLAGGVSGLFVLGSSGEGPWLTASQRREVIDQTVRVVDGRVPVLAGVIEPSTGRTMEWMRIIEDSGVDAAVIGSPYYFPADSDCQRRHVETVASHSKIPLVLYNIPPATHNPISPGTVRKLLEVESLVGIKDSSGDWQVFRELLELPKIRPGFSVLQGAEKLSARAMLAGADGIVPGLGNLVPDLFVRLVTSARSGDEKEVWRLQEQANKLWHLHTQGFWLDCLKYAASVLGLSRGALCGRDGALSEPEKAMIRQLLRMYGPNAEATRDALKEVVE